MDGAGAGGGDSVVASIVPFVSAIVGVAVKAVWDAIGIRVRGYAGGAFVAVAIVTAMAIVRMSSATAASTASDRHDY
jgi:hypothetical protein